MSARTMTLMILGLTLAVTALPNNREQPAAASDGVTYATVAETPKDVAPSAVDDFRLMTASEIADAMASKYCPPQSEPMTVCTPEGCYPVASAPEASVVTKTVSYAQAQPQTVYRARQGNFRSRITGGDGRLFDGDGFLIDRRAARCNGRRPLFAPFRWLRRR